MSAPPSRLDPQRPPGAGYGPSADRLDVVIVSLGSTGGLRAVDEELLGSLRRAGASAEIVGAQAQAQAPVRTLMLTDLRWALAARRALGAQLARARPRAIVYSTTTAALLWPARGAIRFDAPAAGNRPGRHGIWQRALERRRLAQAPLLLPQSESALDELPRRVRERLDPARTLVLPVPVEPSAVPSLSSPSSAVPPAGAASGAPSPQPYWPAPGTSSVPHPAERDIAAITYAANPHKKGLDRVLAAWGAARRPGERLVVAGATREELRAAGIEPAGMESAAMGSASGHELSVGRGRGVEGVEWVGVLRGEEYRALVRRARVFVCAARREDHGIAQLEALADGCMLVTTPSLGPYVALPIARRLDARLVADGPETDGLDANVPALNRLATALRTALDDPLPDYWDRALAALAPLRRDAVDRLVAENLLPRLLGGPPAR